MRPNYSWNISKRDAWHFKKLLLLVTMIFPKEDPPKEREYCMERKDL